MTSTPPHRTRAAHRMIGEGRHSVVVHRPGSPWVIQQFKPDCSGLTVAKLNREYAYLLTTFATLPLLIPRQRLIAPAGENLAHVIMVKQYIDVDPRLGLTSTPPQTLKPQTRAQIAQFLAIVRYLLLNTGPDLALGTDASLIPDIIDPPLLNLAVDTNGDLRLLDTNRLISSKILDRLHQTGTRLDLGTHTIHALLLRRLLFLESRFLHRTRAELRTDPIYRRYLRAADLQALIDASAAAGEPLRPEGAR